MSQSIPYLKGGYLIIMPKDLVDQSQTELQTRVKRKLHVVIYHCGPGVDRSTNRSTEELNQAGIIITTYETLRYDNKETRRSEETFDSVASLPA
jgi:hypothetical protein